MKKRARYQTISLFTAGLLQILLTSGCYAAEKAADNASPGISGIKSESTSQAAAQSGQDEAVQGPEEAAGEFYGVPVSMSNYKFAKRCVMLFTKKWRGAPKNDQEIEAQTWDDLLLSYEAFKRDIKVTDEEMNQEIGNVMTNSKAAFDWKTDKEAYGKWVDEKLKEPVELFENQVRHLLQLNKLREDIIKGIEPAVTEEDMRNDFTDANTSIEVELVEFEKKEDADAFYSKMQDAKLWNKEKKKDPKFSKRLGFVTIQFLANIWMIPREDLYKMMEMNIDSIYPPRPIYKGYGVFRVLEKSKPENIDMTKFEKQRDYYKKNLTMQRKIDGFKDWFEKYKKEASMKILVKPEINPEVKNEPASEPENKKSVANNSAEREDQKKTEDNIIPTEKSN